MRESFKELCDLNRFTLKISDMGLGKLLLPGQSHGAAVPSLTAAAPATMPSSASSLSLSSSGAVLGTIGWQAPEVIAARIAAVDGSADVTIAAAPAPARSPAPAPSPASMRAAREGTPMRHSDGMDREGDLGTERASLGNDFGEREVEAARPERAETGAVAPSTRSGAFAADIFGMGCTFFHVLVPGGHPFGGQWFEREANISLDDPVSLNALEAQKEAFDLVRGGLVP